MAKISAGTWVELPRGGFLTNTSEGLLQVGCPPETIKDSIAVYGEIARIFIVPKFFFSLEKYISLAELEFPIYYNFFLQKRKTIIVCDKKHQKRFSELISSSLFGPAHYNLKQDYIEPKGDDSNLNVPDLKKEVSYFVNFRLDEVVEFKTYAYSEEINIGKVFLKAEKDNINIRDTVNETTVTMSNRLIYQVGQQEKFAPENFTPPTLGISCLGASHGFDPNGRTSGFVLWIGQRAIIVDPVVETIEWLAAKNVSPHLIDGIILTHTHADHDVGILRLLFEVHCKKPKLYTTKTILDIWLKKYCIVTGIHEPDLKFFFDFEPIFINAEMQMGGSEILLNSKTQETKKDRATFKFHYTMHSIPTIGFDFSYRDLTFTYSSDHLNDPKYYQKLLSDKTIDETRFAELCNFNWDSDIIYHESGVPPLHTAISLLATLEEEVRKKIRVYHISKKDFIDYRKEYEQKNQSKGSKLLLQLAEENETECFIENTDHLTNDQQILNDNYFLKPLDKVTFEALHSNSEVCDYQQGESIEIKKDDPHCMLILAGKASMKESDWTFCLERSDIVGLEKVVDSKLSPKAHKIKALTHVVGLKISNDSLLPLIDESRIPQLKNDTRNIQKGFFKCLEKSVPHLFRSFLPNHQIPWTIDKDLQFLQSHFEWLVLEPGRGFSTADHHYIHHSGFYKFINQSTQTKSNAHVSLFFNGFKNFEEVLCETLTECCFFAISKKDLRQCCQRYPKLAFNFLQHSTPRMF